ncbi:MAG: universal stress protein [Deltaproteobacteria bacterium]|nr:universal stress protein [Deltaproteobacteria bacterium]
MPTPTRADDFLELVERSKRGRLKVYLGFAAGVGKTYRMLQEAHALRGRGVDVVLGFIETHQRPETAALLSDLERVPLKKLDYRGVVIEEMNLEAVIARRPQVALVDEVAHTNAPGGKNRRRYLDVEDLLDAGINVICAFNIQHLESLNQLVQRATGVTVRETVPDTFLTHADQVVTLDLAVEDLLERLSSGKIYAPDKITTALQNFFKVENLDTLRELALREVAESVDRARAAPAPTSAPKLGASQRVMVCMASSAPRTAELLRRGSRMAGRYNTDWFVVYVQTPAEAPERIDAEAQRHLLANIEMARELGAEVVRLEGTDPVATLIDFARSHGVQHIVIGRSHEPWWRQRMVPSVMLRMLREASGFDLHVLSVESGEEPP